MDEQRKTLAGDIPRRFPIRFADRVHVVDVHTPARGFRNPQWFLFGWQFGPVCAILAENCSDAFEEWDEHYGERVDYVDDASTLADYTPEPHHLRDAQGNVLGAQINAALDCGEIRINGGGTTVWVDHYEWCRFLRPGGPKRERWEKG